PTSESTGWPRNGCSALKVAMCTSVLNVAVVIRIADGDVWTNEISGAASASDSPTLITVDASPAGGGPAVLSLTMTDGTNSDGCRRSTTAISGCSRVDHRAGLSV